MQVSFVAYRSVETSSARMRCFWVAKYWPEARVLERADDPGDADVIVFQKAFRADTCRLARYLRARGCKVVWDLCDPYWWFYPEEHANMAQHVDRAVCSTSALAEDFETAFPLHSPWVIADRQDPEFHPTIKEHALANPPVLIWFGWADNRVALHGTFAVLDRLWAHGRRFALLVLDERPDLEMKGLRFPVIHRRWRLESFHADLLSADIALLPPHPGPLGRLKSNNKTSTAAWAGLPVTDGFDYVRLCKLVDSVEERRAAGLEGRRMAERCYDVRQSVEEWKRLVATLS